MDHPEFPRFLDSNRSKGRTYIDWGAAWRQWLRNAPLFARTPPSAVLGKNGVQPAPKPGEYDWQSKLELGS